MESNGNGGKRSQIGKDVNVIVTKVYFQLAFSSEPDFLIKMEKHGEKQVYFSTSLLHSVEQLFHKISSVTLRISFLEQETHLSFSDFRFNTFTSPFFITVFEYSSWRKVGISPDFTLQTSG